MKKIVIIGILIFSVFLYAQEKETQNLENFSFTTTVKSLNSTSVGEIDHYIQEGSWLILDGSLSSLTLLSGRGEEYLLEALLVQGEWKNLDEVIKYECRLIFQGDKWKSIVPSRAPREIKEGMILLNSHVLVLGRLVSFERSGTKIIPYLMVDQIRIIP